MQRPTEAAMNIHRFESPLDPDAEYREVPLVEADIDLETLRLQAEAIAAKKATDVSNKVLITKKMRNTEPELVTAKLAERILNLLILSRYRRGPVQFVNEGKQEFTEKICDAIRNDRPIELILSFFGYKVQNPLKTWAVEGSEVDISEMASILRFYEITEGIRAIYPPGAVFHIACDGRKYADAIGFTEEQGRDYFTNIKAMAKAMGIDKSVHLFDEANHYPADHAERTERHLKRVQDAYAENDPAITQFVTKLRTSMCLSMPIDTCITLPQLRMAFSCLPDNELCVRDPKSLDIRRHILNESEKRSMKYVAVYDAVKEANVIEGVAPNALRASVHPKPRQLGLYAVSEHSHDIFPHHGQGIAKMKPEEMDIEKVRIRFRADIERVDADCVAFCLPKDKYDFAKTKHPFFVSL